MIWWLLLWFPIATGEPPPVVDQPIPPQRRDGAEFGAVPVWRRRQE